MSLKPCRACKKEVDTSAISCPNCGATRPAHKLSQQTYHLIILLVQVIVGLTILYFIASAVWKKAEPFVMKSGVVQQQQLKNPSNNINSDNDNESDNDSDYETE